MSVLQKTIEAVARIRNLALNDINANYSASRRSGREVVRSCQLDLLWGRDLRRGDTKAAKVIYTQVRWIFEIHSTPLAEEPTDALNS